MSAKTLFLRDEQATKDALAITKSDAFEKLVAYARSAFAEMNPTSEQSRGASVFIELLTTLADRDAEETKWTDVTTGAMLDHNLEIPIRQIKEQPSK